MHGPGVYLAALAWWWVMVACFAVGAASVPSSPLSRWCQRRGVAKAAWYRSCDWCGQGAWTHASGTVNCHCYWAPRAVRWQHRDCPQGIGGYCRIESPRRVVRLSEGGWDI